MGQIQKDFKVQPFVAIMYKNNYKYEEALAECISRFGEPLGISDEYNFSEFTSYYEKEFGANLKKRMHVFGKPRELENFHRNKIWSNKLETELSKQSEARNVNIDPGYLGLSKLVLFSTKNYSHRIYISDGIFAEVTLVYEYSEFKNQSWTYPDYADEKNLSFITDMREKIKQTARAKGYMLNLI